jgi:hypothetical protein
MRELREGHKEGADGAHVFLDGIATEVQGVRCGKMLGEGRNESKSVSMVRVSAQNQHRLDVRGREQD